MFNPSNNRPSLIRVPILCATIVVAITLFAFLLPPTSKEQGRSSEGVAPAQVELALIYEKGMGVPQNNILAHMWLNLAALQGREDAKSHRDSVAKLMTPTEIAKAESLAREWVPDLDWLQPSEYGIK